ncbi:hypothetical protein J3R30DRAFT_3800292 [Lentinula aciculospora]|uniref:Uncharacterized protein n=1 Tax=Lentinula aciculospora TaxID=153920 RepID=A0A9W9DIV1_9AGAR|nr:hypothetical protein J3R30DRAFT_3800292 [Lentinula aciculospora]
MYRSRTTILYGLVIASVLAAPIPEAIFSALIVPSFLVSLGSMNIQEGISGRSTGPPGVYTISTGDWTLMPPELSREQFRVGRHELLKRHTSIKHASSEEPGFSTATGLQDEERSTDGSVFGSPTRNRHSESHPHTDPKPEFTSETSQTEILKWINHLSLNVPLQKRLKGFALASNDELLKPTWNALFDILQHYSVHYHKAGAKCGQDILDGIESADIATQLRIITLLLSEILDTPDRVNLKGLVDRHVENKQWDEQSIEIVDDMWIKYYDDLMHYTSAFKHNRQAGANEGVSHVAGH